MYSADRRRLTCVLNGAVGIVYRPSTVVADVLQTKIDIRPNGDDLGVIDQIFVVNREFFIHTCIRCRRQYY